MPCPGFAGNWQVLKSKVSYAEQPHPQPSMCSCTSPGSTLTRWPVLCPSLLSLRPYPTKFCPAFGVKAQPLELPPVLRTVHLLETATTRGATALCCQWALLTQGDRSLLGNWENLALMPVSQQGLNNDKGDDGHGHV